MRDFLTSLPRYQKRTITLVFDTLCIWFSIFAALTLRLGDFQWFAEDEYSWKTLLFAGPLASLPFFIRLGLYRAVLRYINSVALTTILKAVLLATISFMVVDEIVLVDVDLPRSFPFLYFLNLSLLMIGSRFFMQRWLLGGGAWEVLLQVLKNPLPVTAGKGKRALIFGEGQALVDLVEVLDRTHDYQPVAIINQNTSMVGGEVCGKPVYGVDDIESVIQKFEPHEVLIALPSASKSQRKPVIQFLEKFGLPIKTMPNSEDLASGRLKIQEVQDVDIADVLGREEVTPIPELIELCIKDRAVLITGAGGSIGSEIVRQVMKHKPKVLVLLDSSEFNLYSIESEANQAIKSLSLDFKVYAILANVCDEQYDYEILKRFSVDTIYHAAAYKHVPMVERNIFAGIENNVFGTLGLAKAAIAAQVKHFVLISTDKAVRPTNVMGASKRLSELVLQALSNEESIHLDYIDKNFENKTLFTMVRFGNVLGSSGSVIPLFREQIRIGGPVTVTHPEVNRFFMSIPEAAQLVLQAGSLAKGGDVFVLDMGSAVKVLDLAKRMIQLSGLKLKSEDEEGIEIEFVGLRPGEKLYEELLIGENPEATQHPRIFKEQEGMIPWPELNQFLAALEAAMRGRDYRSVQQLLNTQLNGYEAGPIVDWLSVDNHSV